MLITNQEGKLHKLLSVAKVILHKIAVDVRAKVIVSYIDLTSLKSLLHIITDLL